MILEDMALKPYEYLAIIVSCTSILLGFWGSIQQYRHFRQSVKPVADIKFSFASDEKMEIALKNSGLGPMTIKKIEIFDLTTGKKERIHIYFKDYSNLRVKKITGDYTLTHTDPNPYNILTFNFGDVKSKMSQSEYNLERSALIEKLKKLRVFVTYYDIYENEWLLYEQYGSDDSMRRRIGFLEKLQEKLIQ
jgi:hypothetical protein